MHKIKNRRLFCLSALVAWGLMAAACGSTVAGQTAHGAAPRESEGRGPVPITGNTPSPFQLRVSGEEEVFLPHSAWHCPEFAFNDHVPDIPIDEPDTPAIFFRDASGTIHMFAMGPFNYAFLGKSVDDLKENCHSVYLSHYDTNPAHYQYQEWIRAAYTLDGTHVYGVAHDEFYCRDHLGTCDYRALTAVHSSDGGYTFKDEPMPQRLIAMYPYRNMDIPRDPDFTTGISDNSDIIRNPNDGFYYMTATDHSAARGCVLRSQDLSTWVSWDGTAFSVRLDNPKAYKNPPGTYDCHANARESLQYLAAYNLFLGLFGNHGDLEYEVSNDLVHWSAPESIGLPVIFGRRHDGSTNLTYPSILDPSTKSTNFDVINSGDQLYLLLVKSTPINDGRRINYSVNREIVRFPLSLTPVDNDESAVHSVAVTFAPAAGTYREAQTVTLSCKTPSSMIYYTTDGQAPSMDTFYTNQYTGPLAVAQSEKITAVCLSTGYRPGPVRAAQYRIGSGG